MAKKTLVIFALLICSFPITLKIVEPDVYAFFSSSPKIYHQPLPSSRRLDIEKQVECLALNIYFEAGVESTRGKIAIAQVTLNRVRSSKFPNTICEVVKQSKLDWRGNPRRHKCQFSWYCDGKPDKPWRGKNWRESVKIARYYVDKYYGVGVRFEKDITQGSIYYHARYVRPYWAKYMRKTTVIGRHIFYR